MDLLSKTLEVSLFVMTCVVLGESQKEEISVLDNFLVPFRVFNEIFFGISLANSERRLAAAPNVHRFQTWVPEDEPFPCPKNNTRSPKRPESVHELRPGDIDVVGAIGDSLTAGYGLLATNVFDVLIARRGTSFGIGGRGTWRRILTLPNILKEFNPNLVGYSLGPSLSIQQVSQFNVGEGGAVSKNSPYMTKVLITRMKNDRRVDFDKDWKMVTYLMGANDFCTEICYEIDPWVIVEKHKRDLVRVLRLLRDNLPRTIVNVLPAPNIKILKEMTPSQFCEVIRSVWCPCLFSLSLAEDKAKVYYEIMTQWQVAEMEVSGMAEFDRPDFTVVFQPFFLNFTFPTDTTGNADFSLLSPDCFHFSQKGNALVASALWNNLLEPVGQKSTDGGRFVGQKIFCPTDEHPFIHTRRNSR